MRTLLIHGARAVLGKVGGKEDPRSQWIGRLRKKRPETDNDEGMALVADDRPGPEVAAIASSKRARIEASMGELEPEKVDAVRSVYLDGETSKKLAARHDVPLNTMRSWLRRSLLKLKDCLTR